MSKTNASAILQIAPQLLDDPSQYIKIATAEYPGLIAVGEHLKVTATGTLSVTGVMLPSNNLSEVDPQQARQTLEVSSTSEVVTALSEVQTNSATYTDTLVNNLKAAIPDMQAVKSVAGKDGDIELEPADIGYPSLELLDRRTKDARFLIDDSGRSQQDRNTDDIELKDYIKYVSNGDWTAAIKKADTDALAQSKSVYVAGGVYNYSSDITLTANWRGAGMNCTRFSKTASALITQISGSIYDITIGPQSYVSGDVKGGLYSTGNTRKFIDRVWIENHGGDGFVYDKGNLSRFYLHSRLNKGHGVRFGVDTADGNNKANDIWFEVTGNQKSGFIIDQGTNTFQTSGQNTGFIIAQSNGSSDTSTYKNVDISGYYNDFRLYTEYVTGVRLRSLLKGSNIYFMNMAHDLLVNEADESNVISWIPSANGTRSTIAQYFEKWIIQNQSLSYSGRLSLSHTANNTFTFLADGSGAQQYLELPTNLTLRGSANAYQFAQTYTSGATLTGGSIPANSAIERTITHNKAVTSLQTAVIVSPAGDIGAGLVWSSYISAFDATANTTTITVRIANPTTAAVTMAALAWRAKIIL